MEHMAGKVAGDRWFDAMGGVIDRSRVKTVHAYLDKLIACRNVALFLG